MTILLRSLRFLLIVPLCGIATGLTVMAAAPYVGEAITAIEADADEVSLDQLDELGTRTLVFDVNGTLISALYAENRELIDLEEIPDEVITAVLVVEDEDFYLHKGINIRSTIRALRENVGAGGISQGGSTITQQLIKNLLVGDDQTLERKMNEAAYAWRLERTTDKDEILEQYLNTVYLGATAYGVKAAAEVYWDKEPQDLGWVEAAMLASLISSPTAYDPTLYPEEAERQREIVLDRLAELEYITLEEAAEYNRAPLPVARNELEVSPQDYFLERVRLELLNDFRLGATEAERRDAVERGGLRVFTTFDPAVQAMAEAARDQVLPDDPRFTMAIAALEPATGAVKAVVGGPGFEEVKFDLATQGERQPGSSFKTFVLVTAFENGYQASDRVSGTGPCTFEIAGAPDYVANNFGRSGGSIDTIRGQTTRSSNCAYLRLGQIVGLENVIQTARAMGLSTDLEPVLSLPLGAKEVIPLEMASAYSVVANNGLRNEPYYIERVEVGDGPDAELLFSHEVIPQQVISQTSACWATEILAANVRGGTGTAAGLPNQVAAGKTGTTEDFVDAWFVGFTPYLATAVWMGNPEERVPMRGVGGVGSVTGGSFPARAWGAFNTAYHENLEPVSFPGCDGPSRSPRFLRTENDAQIFNPCPGQLSVDDDQDGNADGCIDDGTEGVLECGTAPTVDEQGNQIPLFCNVNHVECGAGSVGVDTDGDGVRDTCGPPPPPALTGCAPGETPIDDNADGVADRCVNPNPPPPPALTGCAPGETPIDDNADGVADRCVNPNPPPPPPPAPTTITCAEGEVPVDTTGDGVADTCLPQTE
ncbi:MAG: transglycosylase domain-containing protein [Acidimicrobiia bacterium]|nr:transglycosylase domain-containing protein [Acidimicrobiia bacterium]